MSFDPETVVHSLTQASMLAVPLAGGPAVLSEASSEQLDLVNSAARALGIPQHRFLARSTLWQRCMVIAGLTFEWAARGFPSCGPREASTPSPSI